MKLLYAMSSSHSFPPNLTTAPTSWYPASRNSTIAMRAQPGLARAVASSARAWRAIGSGVTSSRQTKPA